MFVIQLFPLFFGQIPIVAGQVEYGAQPLIYEFLQNIKTEIQVTVKLSQLITFR